MTNATAIATAVQSSFSHYNVLDTIEDITHPTLKAMVLSSMEWSIKTQCINQARNVFYQVRKDADDMVTEGGLSEFVNAIAGLEANAQYNTDLGFAQNGSAITKVAQLMQSAQQWYDKAETAHGSAKMTFKCKTFEELVADEKVRLLDDNTKSKISAYGSMIARGDVTKQALITEALIKQQQNNQINQAKSRELVAPAVMTILGMAEYRGGGEEIEFYELDTDVQKRLISAAKGAVERSMTTLATWRGVSMKDYADLLLDGFKAIEELDAVLNSTKFNPTGS